MRFTKPKILSIFFILVGIIAIVTLASWNLPMSPGMFDKFFSVSDTIPGNCKEKLSDLDEAFAKLEKAKIELKEKDIAASVTKALREINIQQIQESVDNALADADVALDKVDLEHIKSNVASAIAKINTEKINEQVKIAAENLKPQIEKSIEEARLQIEKAQKEITDAKKQLRTKS
ncbi:hypothetical protein [Niabella ginsengisoli]|uniref:Uncharacterized protein n=1 Tax=Niabella ginsengisoli TaxID=522298 RepID=A0ABS9SR90_9BACT|nr:hypothetical protein [Niabella ginsengisoli]MCH5600912.1 hypothetical protein [Niabella ginsengisoli]